MRIAEAVGVACSVTLCAGKATHGYEGHGVSISTPQGTGLKGSLMKSERQKESRSHENVSAPELLRKPNGYCLFEMSSMI